MRDLLKERTVFARTCWRSIIRCFVDDVSDCNEVWSAWACRLGVFFSVQLPVQRSNNTGTTVLLEPSKLTE